MLRKIERKRERGEGEGREGRGRKGGDPLVCVLVGKRKWEKERRGRWRKGRGDLHVPLLSVCNTERRKWPMLLWDTMILTTPPIWWVQTARCH